jgi:hypothetical protein
MRCLALGRRLRLYIDHSIPDARRMSLLKHKAHGECSQPLQQWLVDGKPLQVETRARPRMILANQSKRRKPESEVCFGFDILNRAMEHNL